MTRFNRSGALSFLGENGLPIAPATLAKTAVQGSRPPYQLWGGQATYDAEDLLVWAQLRLGPKLRSTSDCRRASFPPDTNSPPRGRLRKDQ
jgi:hypothetical protein